MKSLKNSNVVEGAFFNTEDFRLLKEKVGEGSFGTVYIAEDIHSKEKYACKVLKTQSGFNGHEQMLLMRESLILNQLKHPSIVNFKGVNFQSFSDPNKLEPSILTEYKSHGSLRNILNKEKKSLSDHDWTPTKKYITLLGIANAMKYLHSNGVIHRDLKPENILLDESFYPCVSDFGLSRYFSIFDDQNLTMTGQIESPLYMAPELLSGEKHYGPSVDVYAFAMIAYEVITGKTPFYEHGRLSPVALGIKVSKGVRPNLEEGISEKMKDLLSRCWSDKESERPSFDEIVSLLSEDTSFIAETVDEDEISDYIDTIDDLVRDNKKPTFVSKHKKLQKKQTELEDELEKMKQQLASFSASNEYFLLALHNLIGHKEELDASSAINYLRQSSSKGNSNASFALGLLYFNDRIIPKDIQEATKFLELTTAQGNSSGLNALGFYYQKGYGVEQDYNKAREFYEKSSELGNSYALNNLGDLYYYDYGVEQDYNKAREFYEKSSELGNSVALNNLGYLYENGYGVEQDYNKALEFYEKSSELGNSYALNNLGDLYYYGYGVEQDYNKAREFYEKSLELGNSDALNNLGYLYEKGYGVEQDYNKALEFYEKSSKLGNPNAAEYISDLQKKMK